jgi:hypothetical protein
LIENKDITGSIRIEDGTDPVSEFIGMYVLIVELMACHN